MRNLLRAAGLAECVLDHESARRYLRTDGMVVAPRTSEQAAAIFEVAAREGWSIRCGGGGTRSLSAEPVSEADLVLTTMRMDRLTDYEPADLVMTVQAGVTLAQIETAASRHRQFLALDPPAAAGSTLGGVIATAAAGPLRFAHGTPRDHVLGIEVVAGDARVLHFGGKVVKNVAGYDVVRPLIGSHGTLGLITEASVRLKPLPELDATVLVELPAPAAALELAAAIIAARLDVVALEIVSAELTVPSTGWTLLARFHGNAEAVREESERLRALAGAGTMRAEAGAAPWRSLAESEAAARVNLRLADLPSRLETTVAAATGLAERTAARAARVAIHSGDGIVRLLADDIAEGCEAILEAERKAFALRGGTFIIARTPRRLAVDAFGSVDAQLLMGGIRRVFDPAGVLARGAFVA